MKAIYNWLFPKRKDWRNEYCKWMFETLNK